MFNEKKEALQMKFPQIADFSLKVRKNYVQQSIQNSLNVKGKLLELGINVSRPLLKSGTVENWYGEDWYFMNQFLYSWVNNANYVELYIVSYTDDSYSTWVDDRNTANQTHITLTGNLNTGKYYFSEGGNTSSVAWIAHTHKNSKDASDADKTSWLETPGLPRYIYYQGGFYDYF